MMKRLLLAVLVIMGIIGMTMVPAHSDERLVYPGVTIRIVFVCDNEDAVIQAARGWNETRTFSSASVIQVGCSPFRLVRPARVLQVIAGFTDWEGDSMYAVQLWVPDGYPQAYTLTWSIAVVSPPDSV